MVAVSTRVFGQHSVKETSRSSQDPFNRCRADHTKLDGRFSKIYDFYGMYGRETAIELVGRGCRLSVYHRRHCAGSRFLEQTGTIQTQK
jgi:hypothetical protein